MWISTGKGKLSALLEEEQWPFILVDKLFLNTFTYHVSCTDRKISVRISLLFYLVFHHRPIRPVENVVLTTKGLKERNTNVGWGDGGKIGKIMN